MTSFYKCCCGYTTKSKEYAEFHTKHARVHHATEFLSLIHI